MEITWNLVALNAQQLKQRGITQESSVVMVSSQGEERIGDVAKLALQSLGSLMVEVNFSQSSKVGGPAQADTLFVDILETSDFVVDCSGGELVERGGRFLSGRRRQLPERLGEAHQLPPLRWSWASNAIVPEPIRARPCGQAMFLLQRKRSWPSGVSKSWRR